MKLRMKGKCTIDVQGALPIKHRLRRMSPKIWKVAIQEVMKMCKKDITEKSWSDWSNAAMMVMKHHGSFWFCVDYRDLNRLTKQDAYPGQHLDGILDELRKARFITMSDLK